MKFEEAYEKLNIMALNEASEVSWKLKKYRSTFWGQLKEHETELPNAIFKDAFSSWIIQKDLRHLFTNNWIFTGRDSWNTIKALEPEDEDEKFCILALKKYWARQFTVPGVTLETDRLEKEKQEWEEHHKEYLKQKEEEERIKFDAIKAKNEEIAKIAEAEATAIIPDLKKIIDNWIKTKSKVWGDKIHAELDAAAKYIDEWEPYSHFKKPEFLTEWLKTCYDVDYEVKLTSKEDGLAHEVRLYVIFSKFLSPEQTLWKKYAEGEPSASSKYWTPNEFYWNWPLNKHFYDYRYKDYTERGNRLPTKEEFLAQFRDEDIEVLDKHAEDFLEYAKKYRENLKSRAFVQSVADNLLGAKAQEEFDKTGKTPEWFQKEFAKIYNFEYTLARNSASIYKDSHDGSYELAEVGIPYTVAERLVDVLRFCNWKAFSGDREIKRCTTTATSTEREKACASIVGAFNLSIQLFDIEEEGDSSLGHRPPWAVEFVGTGDIEYFNTEKEARDRYNSINMNDLPANCTEIKLWEIDKEVQAYWDWFKKTNEDTLVDSKKVERVEEDPEDAN